MSALEYARELLGNQAHSALRNYIVPGLTSRLLTSAAAQNGCIRLFNASREQTMFITPHSHRFDFACCVLRGFVKQTLYIENDSGEEWIGSTLIYDGAPGKYVIEDDKRPGFYLPDTITFGVGEWYSMKHDEIHSIVFSPDAVVLFAEGQNITPRTRILDPFVNNERIPLFNVQDWMFKRD